MAWFWSDDLARLLMERDGVSADRVAQWLNGPMAHRSDLDAIDFARALLAASSESGGAVSHTSAA